MELFVQTCQRVESGEISPESGLELVSGIDYSEFSIDEMENVENADWLPDDFYTEVMRNWLDMQSENLNNISAYLSLTPVVGKDLMNEFIQAIVRPHTSLSLHKDNIIGLMGCGAGNCPYQNPMTTKLITAETDAELPIALMKLENLFSGDPKKFFQSQPKPNVTLIIGFPEFMRVAIDAYTIMSPAQPNKGPRSWLLQGSNDKHTWADLDVRRGTSDLKEASAVGRFSLEKRSQPFRYFRITQLEASHAGNQSLAMSAFDVSGEIKFV